jgi:chromosome partitioning protein
MEKKTTIITLVNNKGGVSKTTSCISLGAALSKKGYNVLLVDCDPQANLTTGMGINPVDLDYTILDLIREEVDFASVVKEHDAIKIIPSNLGLSNAEFGLAGLPAREYLLRDALKPIQDQFDFIIVDTPPSLGIFTLNALSCANYAIIPFVPEPYSLQGIWSTFNSIPIFRKLNASLSILGLIACQVDQRIGIHNEGLKVVESKYGNKLFNTIIRIGAGIKTAAGKGNTIFEFDDQARVAQEYMCLTEEILERLNNGKE